MMTILDTIVEYKRKEVAEQRSRVSIADLEKRSYFGRRCHDLRNSLTDASRTGIIAEFKRRSPSKGVINDRVDPAVVTKAYTTHGASCLSVLTDTHFFGGSVADLQAARINEIPILRKDFMIDEYQIIEAKAIGADVILLIAACLEVAEVKQFAKLAKSLGLSVLLEIHDESELEHICDETDIVGVNNRNLKTFKVDIEQSVALSRRIPSDKLRIAESGISKVETILDLKERGFDGFLIGENFMKEEDPGKAFGQFVEELLKVKS